MDVKWLSLFIPNRSNGTNYRTTTTTIGNISGIIVEQIFFGHGSLLASGME